MPKEVIGSSTPLAEGESPRPQVTVRWLRDCDVQIATLCDVDSADELDPARGWYADLTRYQINQLIRVLRRARDQAYGQDA